MICEICNGNDLIKLDGIYVCQYCGTKYSVEEARKLLVECVLKVDNSSTVNALLKAAHRARDAQDTNAAREYFEKVLQKDPVNWEATFYLKSMVGDIYRFGSSIYTVLALIQDNVLDLKERNDAVELVISHALDRVNRNINTMTAHWDCSKKEHLKDTKLAMKYTNTGANPLSVSMSI